MVQDEVFCKSREERVWYLYQLVAGKVLGVDEAEGVAGGGEDDDVIDAAFADEVNGFGGEGVG